jgi:hypothetical protein
VIQCAVSFDHQIATVRGVVFFETVSFSRQSI